MSRLLRCTWLAKVNVKVKVGRKLKIASHDKSCWNKDELKASNVAPIWDISSKCSVHSEKSPYYCLYVHPKSKVSNSLLKECTDSASLILQGRSFHREGPATAKLQSHTCREFAAWPDKLGSLQSGVRVQVYSGQQAHTGTQRTAHARPGRWTWAVWRWCAEHW